MYGGLPHTGFSYVLYAIVGGSMMISGAIIRAWVRWRQARRRGPR